MGTNFDLNLELERMDDDGCLFVFVLEMDRVGGGGDSRSNVDGRGGIHSMEGANCRCNE